MSIYYNTYMNFNYCFDMINVTEDNFEEILSHFYHVSQIKSKHFCMYSTFLHSIIIIQLYEYILHGEKPVVKCICIIGYCFIGSSH